MREREGGRKREGQSSLAPTSGSAAASAADLSKVAATHDISHVGLLWFGYFRLPLFARSLPLLPPHDPLVLLTLPVGVCGPFKYEIYSSHSGLMFGNGQQITLKAPQQQHKGNIDNGTRVLRI